MKQLVLKIEESRFKLFLQFLRTLDYVTIVQPASTPPKGNSTPRKYDFSDLAGKLEWKGDAVSQQRILMRSAAMRLQKDKKLKKNSSFLTQAPNRKQALRKSNIDHNNCVQRK